MKIKDLSKEGNPIFEPANPKVVYNDKIKSYEIEYDAVYEDGHIEKHTGFGSYKYDIIKEYLRDYFGVEAGLLNATNIIERFQTEDVAPVVHGKWLPQILNKSGLTNIFLCSRCYKFSCTANHHVKCIYTYCPHCGAKMRNAK